jgi:endonuclease III
MEPHKENISDIEKFRPNIKNGAHSYFERASEFANTFYKSQIDFITKTNFNQINTDFFFREYVWVVHASGFSAKAVGRFMPKLIKAYGLYDDLCNEEFEIAFNRIKLICKNKQKSKAIWNTSKILNKGIEEDGWKKFKSTQLSTPEKLSELPYIGKVTCYHLARNIGLLDFVKPDLHLTRLAKYWRYENCVEMCKDIQPNGMPLGIVDLILWYSASTFGTIEIKD